MRIKSINEKLITKCKTQNNQNYSIVNNALTKNSINSIALEPKNQIENNFMFSVELNTLPVLNQKQSGRCWIFAAMNLIRESIAKNLGVENFELSESYLAFWDKYERVNYFLESIIYLKDRNMDDRHLQFILKTGIQDGGQWDMIVNVINKYGIVPKHVMPDSFQACATSSINYLLNWKVRDFAKQIKNSSLSYEQLQELKNRMLKEVYKLLTKAYGPIPTTFNFEYSKKVYNDTNNDNYNLTSNFDIVKTIDLDLTPIDFYRKYVDIKLEDYVSIIHAPQSTKPFNESYSFELLNNVVEGNKIVHYNLELPLFKYLIAKSLKNNIPVWFGSDVSWYGDNTKGVWDDLSYDYSKLFNIDFKMHKGDMLSLRVSAMNHAMLLTGIDLDLNKFDTLLEYVNRQSNINIEEFYKDIEDLNITRWKIENSWGNAVGKNGYYSCSGSWFDKFVYQAVVSKKDLMEISTKLNLASILKKEPIILEPWDPIGTLA